MIQTAMRREIDEIPSAVETLLVGGRPRIVAAARALRDADPRLIATLARGSSDHAAHFLKYAAELTLGLPVASLAPSIASLYGRDLRLADAAVIGISQSGKSPDIVSMLESAVRSGARALALTNTPDSPLARAATHVVDIHAGPELSVAATKTFVTSLVAGLAVIGHWSADTALLSALDALPDTLERALGCDWGALEEALARQESLYVLGRGPMLAIAEEAALKFKETCGLHAQAYSTAEVLHGPSAIVREGFPVLVFAANDESRPSVLETASHLAAQGAALFVADGATEAGLGLPCAEAGHGLTDPIAKVVSFYGFVEALSRRRGLDPDHPPHLKKVTATR